MIDKFRIFRSPTLTSILATKCSACYFCTNSTKNVYDIIITGGGLIGTTLACTLGNKLFK